jgi:hypothetical protein
MPFAPNPCPIEGDCAGQYYDYLVTNPPLMACAAHPKANSHLVCSCNNGLIGDKFRITCYYACDNGYSYTGGFCVRPPNPKAWTRPLWLIGLLAAQRRLKRRKL